MLADTIFPHLEFSEAELEAAYPPRALPKSAIVTRQGPSPTGFMHIGGLYAALISDRIAHQTGGIFFLRLEDTDQKREVEGAKEIIVRSLEHYNIRVDEGETTNGTEQGKYGPYTQSKRRGIYSVFMHALLARGLAYPCFCSPEQLDDLRGRQELLKVRPGYYGDWAACRKLSSEEALAKISSGSPFVLRLKSNGDYTKRVVIEDAIKGRLEMPENDQDIIIRKMDGLPTYHFAHVVDDHLMRTTHVIRADEWVPSLPLHVQLFAMLGWQAPVYAHISPIQKMEGTSKRKLSKRKDPEANVEFYDAEGYPVAAVTEYMLNLANSNFEDWRKAHPTEDDRTFQLSVERIGKSGALFDFAKLANISQEVIARCTPEEAMASAIAWAQKYNPTLARALTADGAYTLSLFNIEREQGKARKDITKWSDLENALGYFFDELFQTIRPHWEEAFVGVKKSDAAKLVQDFLVSYDPSDVKEVWFEKLKTVARNNGYSDNVKAYKQNPEGLKGHVGDIAKLFRVALTGKNQSPDLSEVMRVMGKPRVVKRLEVIATQVSI